MESLISFMLCCIFLSFFYEISIAIDTIAPNQSIADGQSLVSKGESFELGFFKRGNSKNRYLGIWYNNITPQTVVWIANRNNPLTDSSGVLTISSNGNIVLLNGMKKVIWSSNSSRTTKNPVVQLIDSGNLVLRDDESNSESFIWQSFDYPADTLLPGMKLGENLKTGMDWYLTSWKNADDPSPGDFSYSIEFHGQPQLVLLKGSKKLYRSGIWTGQGFSAYTFGPNSVFIPSLISNKDELYYMYRRNDNAVISKFTLNPYGFLERTIWNNQSREWTVMYEVQKDRCDSYGLCGGNGICRINESPIFCECLTGFTPKSQQEWDLFNWSSGCTRRTQLDCRKGDGFVKFTRVKLPDLLQFWTNKNMSLKECEVECLKNCSCTAYASSGIGGGSHGCLLWFGNLIDVRRLIEVDDDDQDLYIRLAASELESISNSIKKENRATVMVIVSVVSGMLLLGSIIWCFIWKKKTPKAGNEDYRKEDIELPLFDLITILTATENFSCTNKIGEGGFGPVYKGKLSQGQEIAVKRLSQNSGQGITEFKNEVILIAKLQHRNLVKLLGGCIQGEERLLIYEYMPNKSLDYIIFDPNRRKLLAWPKQFHVIMGIARGLLYLHQDSRLRIIHRDLKTSNILLDSEMNPKISDFGMARIFGEEQTAEKTKRIAGTYGYMSPEYAVDGIFSMKSDVFSFGVVVLEIVSGMKNRVFYHPNHHHNLLGHVWILWKEGKALELLDACLEESSVISEILRCIQVGLLCVQKFPEDRPIMSSVVFMLGNGSEKLPQPKQPGFFTERSPLGTNKEEFYSDNAATITLLEAR